jgi:tape measure domain-containing protein
MATIKNTITMQDKMTPVLRAIIKSMQSTLDVMAGVDKVSNSAFRKTQKDIRAASDALDDFNRDVDEISPAANQAANSFSRWKNPLVTAASAIYTIKAALQGISQMTDIADTFTLTTARLDLMNDGIQTTGELQNMILASAQRARAEYGATAAAVSKLGILASEAFSSTEEIVAFSELMNKSFKVGGASIQEQTSAMYQLTQAMAAGKLQGDEFRSIMENAPMLAEAIAKFTGRSKGELKEMSSEGLITADIIKGAMFAAAKDINDAFDDMPKTFGDTWTEVKNLTLKAFQPIIEKVSAFINSPAFEQFAQNITNVLIWISNAALAVIDIISDIAGWVRQNWTIIEPILTAAVAAIGLIIAYTLLVKAVTIAAAAPMALAWMQANWPLVLLIATLAVVIGLWNKVGAAGKILLAIIGAIVAAIVIWTAVQWILNAALTANPIGLIIMAIAALIAIIAAVVLWIMNLWETNMDFKYGVIKIWNSILNFFDQIPIFFQMVGNGIADAFGWAKVQVLTILQGMANGAIGIINSLINAINKIPGVAIDTIDELTFATTTAIEEEAKKQARADSLQASRDSAAAKAAERDAKMATDRAADEAELARKRAEAEAAKQAAQEDQLEGGLEQYLNQTPEEFDWDKYMDNLNIAGGDLDSVGKIKGDVSITDEDIKLLKDVAATEFVNKYTTLRPEMSVSFGDVRETADVNKILSVIEDMIEEAYASSLVGA